MSASRTCLRTRDAQRLSKLCPLYTPRGLWMDQAPRTCLRTRPGGAESESGRNSSRTREARPWVRNPGLNHFSSHQRGMAMDAWGDSCTVWYFEMQKVTAVAHFDTMKYRQWQQLHTLTLWSAESNGSYTLSHLEMKKVTTVTHF